jgi:hypothetical protein
MFDREVKVLDHPSYAAIVLVAYAQSLTFRY